MKTQLTIIFITVLLSGCLKSQQFGNIKLIEEHYPTGLLKSIGATIDNKKEGYWVNYNENGIVEIQCVYINDKLNGPIKFYYTSGQIKREGYILNDSTFYGEWINYHPNGQIEAKGIYKDGEMNGIWEYYTEEGQLNRKVEYVNGHKEKVLLDNKLMPPIPEEQ